MMNKTIASEPCTMIRKCMAIVNEFFRDLGALVKKGIGLGVVLFLALTTLSVLNQSQSFLKSLVKQRVGQVIAPISQMTQPPGMSPVNVQRPVYAAPAVYPKQASRSVQTDARGTIRESGYFVGELERFMRTLARLGK